MSAPDIRPAADAPCPECGTLLPAVALSCPSCGCTLEARRCPRGCGPLSAVVLGGASLDECSRCGGHWVRRETFEHLCRDERVDPAAFESRQPPRLWPEADSNGAQPCRCPSCRRALHRLHFGRRSAVIVHLCLRDGLWFDGGDLRRALDFARAGGLEGVERG